MDPEHASKVVQLFELASSLFKAIPRRKRNLIDESEIIFIDQVNGHLKPRRAYTFMEVVEAIEEDSKAIGLIFFNWSNSDQMEMREFPNLSSEEQAALAAAFAEAQDQQTDINEEYGD